MGPDIRLFLVDDHTIIREGMASLLSTQPGLVVVGQAESAEATLATLPGMDVDVALVDLRLPGQDGIALTTALREIMPVERVLVISMHHDRASVHAAFQAGARGYLPKTARIDELSLAIQVVHQGNWYVHESVAGFLLSALALAAESATHHITSRESLILDALGKGLSNKEIAAQIHLSLPMVKKHLHLLYRKFGVEDRAQLMAALSSLPPHGN